MTRLTKSKKESLRLDRKNGLTIYELMDKYNLPKTTVWNNMHDVKLSKNTIKDIRSRQGGSVIKMKKELARADAHATELLSGLNSKNIETVLLSLFIGLYWAEGTKGAFVFTNTDEHMIRVFMRYMYEYLHITQDDIDVWVRMHSDLSAREEEIRKHWAKVVGVSIQNVRVNYDDRHNKCRTEYGICRIRLKKGGYHLKLVHSLIDGIIGRTLGCPRSSRDRTRDS